MPRILSPNSSFQRKGSNTYHVSYRPANSAKIPDANQRRYSYGGPSQPTQSENFRSSHSLQHHNYPTPDKYNNKGPHPSTSVPPQSTRPTQLSPKSRFRIVSRRNSTPDSSTSSSFIPSSNMKEEAAWGQFVDVAEEEAKIICHSRILSRA